MKIEALNVSYSYNFKDFAIKGINTTINEKDFVAIIGHTGSGKSTFVQTLNGLIIPTSGQVHIDDFIIKDKIKISNIKQLRKKVGTVFQFPEYQLFEDTVEKDILFGPKNFKMENANQELAIKALNLVGLDKSFLEKSPYELSGGERRRVAIAGILAFNPDVLIVDEPTAGLDPSSSLKMLDLFKNLNDNGKTIILITHQMEHVNKYANRVLVFKESELIDDTTPNILYNDYLKVKGYGINVPDIIELIYKLEDKYPGLKELKINNIDDFIAFYKGVMKK